MANRIKLAVLDLFSGIGGFALGLERAGLETVAFCEIDPFARKVLAKHWPAIPIYEDIRELNGDRIRADGITWPAVLCGGFPCVDISNAGDTSGGMWAEYLRLVGDIRPAFVVVENVAALLVRGMGKVLSDLATVGYDAEWHCIPVSAIGANHQRDRAWILAYPNDQRIRTRPGPVPGANEEIPEQHAMAEPGDANAIFRSWAEAVDQARIRAEPRWQAKPGIRGMVNGVPGRLDRLRTLGNAVCPDLAELIGNVIIERAREYEPTLSG